MVQKVAEPIFLLLSVLYGLLERKVAFSELGTFARLRLLTRNSAYTKRLGVVAVVVR